MNKHIHDEARRNAEETLAMVNADLRNPRNANNAHRRHMLTDMKEKAMRTLEHHDRMYGDDRYDDVRRMYNETMDLFDRILPKITGDYDDETVDRRGVPGTGRHGRRGRVRVGGYTRRRPRAEMDDYSDDYTDRYDDMDDAENRRYRSRRTGRFVRGDTDEHMNDVTRTAADAAAETARRIHDDRRNIYPHTPVMPRYDRHDDRTDDDRQPAGIGPGRSRQ